MPLYLAGSLCLGTGALTLILAAALRSGRRELRYFLGFFASLCLLDASNLVLFSLGSSPAGAGGISPLMFALMILNKSLTVTLSLSASLMAQAILDVPWRKLGTFLACALSAISLPFNVLPPMLRYDPLARSVIFGAALDSTLIAAAVNIVYALGTILLFRSRIPEARVKRLALGFLVLSGAYSPALIGDFMALKDTRALTSLAGLSASFPLYLAALSIAVIALALPYLAGPRERAAMAAAKAGGMAKAKPLELADKHDLTTREGEIVGLIVRGRSNKEIAWELGISVRTVGNHIYSLYRKIGINSRFELMGLLARQEA